jgi:uncharacterized protein YndB with AHSA1/START domain
MIEHSIEIDRRPEEVFAYLDQPERHGEWQNQIVSAELETNGPVGVGTRVREIRRIGGREQDPSYEITEHDPPRRSAFRGIVGPVRPVGTVMIEPIGDGSKARVSIAFTLVGHGIGKLIAPLARMQARRSIVESQERFESKTRGGRITLCPKCSVLDSHTPVKLSTAFRA